MKRDIAQNLSTRLFRTTLIAGMALGASTARTNANVLVHVPRPATRPNADTTGIDDALAAINSAQKEEDVARLELIRAQAELSSVVIKLRGDLETGSDIIQATKAWYATRTHYVDMARPILDSLAQRPDYRDATAAFDQALQNTARVRSRAAATTEERIAAGEAVLAARTAVAKLENEALSTAAAVVESRQACLDATRHLRDVRAQVVRSIQQHPRYLAAKQAADDARDRLVATDEKLATVLDRTAGQMAVRQGLSDVTTSQDASDPP